MLYNYPDRTGVDTSPKFITRLSELKNLRYVKKSTGEMPRITELLRRCGASLGVFCGCNTIALESLMVGAIGWVGGVANVLPAYMKQSNTSVTKMVVILRLAIGVAGWILAASSFPTQAQTWSSPHLGGYLEGPRHRQLEHHLAGGLAPELHRHHQRRRGLHQDERQHGDLVRLQHLHRGQCGAGGHAVLLDAGCAGRRRPEHQQWCSGQPQLQRHADDPRLDAWRHQHGPWDVWFDQFFGHQQKLPFQWHGHGHGEECQRTSVLGCAACWATAWPRRWSRC